MVLNKSPETIAIIGPTATGKTRIGVEIAKKLGSDVISVDSQLVYQGLNIGVAKPTIEEMQGIRHHMIDVAPPTVTFSAGDYAEMARPLLKHNSVLVGGTGFYLRALLQPDHLPPIQTDPRIRARLKEYLASNGPQMLYQNLQNSDPRRAAQLHPNDTTRVIRALEVIEHTGKPIPQTPTHLAFPVKLIGLTYRDRDLHRQIIRTRLRQMMADGFLEEVDALYQTHGFCAAMQKAHGYAELLDVLTGKRTLEDALLQVEINIRQYARRQMTWFRKIPDIHWFYVDETKPDTILLSIIDERDCV